MVKVSDVINWVEQQTGHSLNQDEGVHHGSSQTEVKQALVCWMATRKALAAAAEMGAGFVIGHESLYYPYNAAVKQDNPPGWEDWRVNRQRRELLEESGLTFLRVHGSADEICILDDFAALLRLGQPVVKEDKYGNVYEIDPCPLAALVEKVKARTSLTSVRVSAPQGLEQEVSRIGLPWGGMGLSTNVGYQEQLAEQGCDVFIAGEADNYAFRFAAECGIPVIETSHEVSENPGLRHFTEMLAAAFPAVRFRFYENVCIWRGM